MADTVHVALFDDSQSIRDSLSSFFGTTDGIGLCGCYPNAEHLLQRIAACKPDVVLMDIDMPGMDGIQATALLHKHHPDLPVIMLTVFDNEDRVYASLCAGARGYLLKNSNPNALLDAIAEVRNGGAPMSPGIARKVMLHFQRMPSPPRATMEDHGLSPREKEVLQGLVEGLSYKLIADKLEISYETVRSHMKRIYEKLQVHNNTEAVAKTLKGGFLS